MGSIDRRGNPKPGVLALTNTNLMPSPNMRCNARLLQLIGLDLAGCWLQQLLEKLDLSSLVDRGDPFWPIDYWSPNSFGGLGGALLLPTKPTRGANLSRPLPLYRDPVTPR